MILFKDKPDYKGGSSLLYLLRSGRKILYRMHSKFLRENPYIYVKT